MKLENLTIVITGGAGFIGSHLVSVLAKDNRVVVYDNFSSAVLPLSYLRNLSTLSHLSNLRIIKGDILDEKYLSKSLKDVDMIFHLAVACVRLSLGSPTYVHEVNATGTLNTLLAAKKAKVKRFIYISSSEVYGSALDSSINEDHPINPTTVYGMSKYVGECYTKLFHNHEGLPSIIVRPFNSYGPRSHFDGIYGEVIPRFVLRALSGRQPIIFGSGNQKRDFTYIEDSVDGIVKAAESDKLVGDTVNIAYGHDVSVTEVAKYVCALTNLPYKPLFKPPRPNDVARHAADITKAQKLLSYRPAVSIHSGLKKYIEWVKATYKDPKELLHLIPEKNW